MTVGFAIRLQWSAANVNDLIDDGYDLWKVERDDGGYASIAPQNAWSLMVRDMPDYVFRHAVQDHVLKPYRSVPVKSSDLTEGTPVSVSAEHAGYCSLQDVRDQGYAASAYADDLVYRAINKASNMIDRICRQWFDPRFMFVSLNGRDHDSLFLSVPIITVMQIQIDEQNLALDDFVIYNRHLTHGIAQPDDRANPMIAWGDGRTNIDIRRLYGGGTFAKARKSIRVAGIFGYTDIGAGYMGETVVHNQIPLSYGETPTALIEACLRLTIKYMVPLEDGDDMNNKHRVKSEKTRDQSYTLGEGSESDNSYGMTGIIQVDKILQMYPPPLDLVGV